MTSEAEQTIDSLAHKLGRERRILLETVRESKDGKCSLQYLQRQCFFRTLMVPWETKMVVYRLAQEKVLNYNEEKDVVSLRVQ